VLRQALLREPTLRDTASPAARPSGGAPERALHGRVLLAEDNPVNQEVAAAMLAALGCEVRVVEHGRAALEALEREAFDLVLMDCQMPEMDGFAATRALRAREAAADGALRRTPVVALTAHALPADREQCLAAGMDDHVSKPFGRDQLRAVLEHWLKQAEREAAAEPPAPQLEDGAAQAPGVLEPGALAELRELGCAGASDVVTRVVEAYLRSAPELLRALEDAERAADTAGVARAAHTLKSSSAQVGAARLALLAKELEALGRGGSLEGVAERIRAARAELDAVQEALAAEMLVGAR
jgi:CheY-like chemotaxis protein/HPt (histidine-containing phosphotransfer) domain-containing protein